jgi:uncharacterized phage protein gp47/JayE
MTFVAQPYERFVDDLLTALTGGTIREEHQFTGRETPYSLASPGVLAGSLKVYGQRNETFNLFDPGIDYDYDATNQALVWKLQGKLPDDHSYFYVSYYPQEGVRTLTDRNPGSVTTTLAEAFARELAVLHKQMEGIYQSAFVDLATDSALDYVVALLGLTRKDAKFASGEVVFKRTTPAPGDIAIDTGTLISTDQGQNFETTDKRTLRKGQLAVIVPIRAQVDGPAGKVEAGAIKNMNRPIFGVESVLNEAATFFANQQETDEELRRRLQGTLERAGKSTLDAIKYALIEDIPEITETNIQVSERPEVPGVVEVRLGLESTGDADLVRRIEETIFYARPAGVRVSHNLPSGAAGGSSGGAGLTREQAVADFAAQNALPGLNHVPQAVLDTMPQGVLNLRLEVFLRLTQANLSTAQKETIEDNVRQTVTDYVEALPMGAPLIVSKLLGRIVAAESILDAALLVGTDTNGTFTSFQSNLATDGRKAKAQQIFVGLMDEVVHVDVTVTLEAQPQAPADAGQLLAAIRQDGPLYGSLHTAVTAQLAATNGTLSRSTLEAAIRPLVQAATPLLQFSAPQGLSLSAEYVETGRLLNNTEQLAVADNEVPSLRRLTVILKGDLDV